MKIEVNIEKKYALLIIGALIILSFGILSYAYTVAPGAVPNPGHTLASIQGYFSGDANLQTSLGKFCQGDGTGCPLSPTSGVYTLIAPSVIKTAPLGPRSKEIVPSQTGNFLSPISLRVGCTAIGSNCDSSYDISTVFYYVDGTRIELSPRLDCPNFNIGNPRTERTYSFSYPVNTLGAVTRIELITTSTNDCRIDATLTADEFLNN